MPSCCLGEKTAPSSLELRSTSPRRGGPRELWLGGGEPCVEAPAWGGELRMEAPSWGVGRRAARGDAGAGRRVEAPACGGAWRCRRGAAGSAWRCRYGAAHGWGSRLEGPFYFFNPCPVSLGTDFLGKYCNIFLWFQTKMVGHCLFPINVVPGNLSLGNFLGKLFP
jgi:hypothetical protein